MKPLDIKALQERLDKITEDDFQVTFTVEDMDNETEGHYNAMLDGLLKNYNYPGTKDIDDLEVFIQVRGIKNGMDESMMDMGEKKDIMDIMAKYPEAVAKLKQTNDVLDVYDTDLYYDLFSYYADSGEMPYGTVKARDGETGEALAMRFKRQVKRTGLHDEIRNAYMERFKSKSEKKREKHLKALKRLKRNQNRY